MTLQKIKNYFALQQRGSHVRTEILAGMTTFMTMAYILAVNPRILGAAGMDSSAVFVATAVSAAVATGLMGFFANMPLALAPSMGQNAFFTYTVVLGMGHSWQFGLTAVLLVGILFLLLTVTNLRGALLHAMPPFMKHAMTVGVGLFMAFIGLQWAGFVVEDAQNLVQLGSMQAPRVWVGGFSLFFTAILLCLKVRGALFLGIVGSTLWGIPLGVTPLHQMDMGLFFHVPSVLPTFFQFEWQHIFSMDMFVVVTVFLFANLFDTMATLLGVARQANILDATGNLPKAKQAFMADSLATTLGAMLGTSPLTTYIESMSGVAEGGKTGIMALTVSALFLLSLLLAPLFSIIPQEATAGILILVGLFMVSALKDIDMTNLLQALPAFVTILLMPLTYSIANGIMGGVLSYVLLALCTGQRRQVHGVLYILSVFFLLKFVYE